MKHIKCKRSNECECASAFAKVHLGLVRFPNLYFGSRLGAQYPKNSKIFLWLLPQPSSGNALVCVDKNWNISGLLSGFQLEKLFFIHTVRSYSHSTATAEFVKATAGFVMSSEASDQLYFSHFSTFRFVLGNIWLFSCVILTNTVEKVRNPSHFFKPIEVTNSAVAVEWL